MEHLKLYENYSEDGEKFFPEADKWMWNYCVFLGKFTDSKDNNFDLGIHIGDEISAAIVHGNEPGDYFSGPISNRMTRDNDVYDEKYIETLKRAKEWKKSIDDSFNDAGI
jgi:hypothetical protein